MAPYDFNGKTILVTGAGAGIGKAVCENLYASGAKIIALSLLKPELDALQKELPGTKTIQVDLRDWAATRKALESVGPVDGLVNNAGVANLAPFLEAKEEHFDRQFDVNVKAVFNVSQIVAKAMVESGVKGSIVNLSSIAALVGSRNCALYCGSKGALQAMTKVMAIELGPFGIRVNSVNPTVVKTELFRPFWDVDPANSKLLQRTPLARFAEVEDVAKAIAFLLSDESSMVNGIALPVDGGVTAS